jgi:aspartyl-tRNA(Asn)/glutamyl-tRNA(Gln) amidotransferase subunit A
MKLFPEDHETITGTVKRLRKGETTCEEVLRSCLDRIEHMESSVRAWVLVARESALGEARILDAELQSGRDRGPLHGIPIGVKDIIDVKGLPTSYGLAEHRWVKPQPWAERDAPVVARLREAGAVILGKTVSTPFAWMDPPVTRNPWNFDRTPGGSSSGSAAAVACGMCLGAIGTQTGGSITRPAAFCGVCGMKPTFAQITTEGILPLAPSLDHPGPIARSVADLRVLCQVMLDPDKRQVSDGRPDQREESKPRLALAGGFFDHAATKEVRVAVDAAMYWLEGCGAFVDHKRTESDVVGLLRSHRAILAAEAAATHGTSESVLQQYFLPKMPDFFFPPRLQELLEEGARVTATTYIRALEARQSPTAIRFLAPELDALATPATLGAAPDTSTTGDPTFNSPWSLIGVPTVSFPIGLSADGLPLAVQLIGRAGADLHLLRTAEWCELAIRASEGLGP